jgi:hemoglobin-like flavoprotein
MWPAHRRLADLFYARFFELAPDARALFPEDIARQQLKLMDMIAAIVGALDKREIFQSVISYSGRQHAQFGVTRAHFVAFGDALLWSLECQFGADVERILADIDADHGDFAVEFLGHGELVCLRCPLPVWLAGRAGARPDHPILGH